MSISTGSVWKTIHRMRRLSAYHDRACAVSLVGPDLRRGDARGIFLVCRKKELSEAQTQIQNPSYQSPSFRRRPEPTRVSTKPVLRTLSHLCLGRKA